MGLKLYYDIMSQPSRAILLFLKVNSIPFEAIPVTLRNGQHRQTEFLKINPLGKVPIIDHNGFVLTESVAILKYLCRKYIVAGNWYPQSVTETARVDEFLSWQHLNLRTIISKYFRLTVLQPFTSGSSENELFTREQEIDQMLELVENVWLEPHCYINGSKVITIADLLAISELEQLAMSGYEGTKKYSKLTDYIRLVKIRLDPHFEAIFSPAHKIVQEMKLTSSMNRKSKL